MTTDTTAAPPRLCRQCGRPEHGTAACATVAPLSAEQALAEVPDRTKVICPNCCHQFRAIPCDVQDELKHVIDTATHAAVTHERLKELEARPTVDKMREYADSFCETRLTAHRQREERLRELVRTSRQCLNQTHELKSIGDAIESILNTTDTKERTP